MQGPLEIAYRGIDKTEELDNLIRRKAAKLERICDHMISCRIAVESQKPRHSGNPYRVRIDMTVPPGHELVAKRESNSNNSQESLPVVIHRAFDAAYKQLQELVERQRKRVKKHPQQEPVAFVSRIFPQDGYGFLKTVDGRDIYFHKHSALHNDFEKMEVGMGVRFVEEQGEKGPQASTVEVVYQPGPPNEKEAE